MHRATPLPRRRSSAHTFSDPYTELFCVCTSTILLVVTASEIDRFETGLVLAA